MKFDGAGVYSSKQRRPVWWNMAANSLQYARQIGSSRSMQSAILLGQACKINRLNKQVAAVLTAKGRIAAAT